MLLKLFNVLTIALLINFVNVQQVFDNGYSMEKETPISVVSENRFFLYKLYLNSMSNFIYLLGVDVYHCLSINK